MKMESDVGGCTGLGKRSWEERRQNTHLVDEPLLPLLGSVRLRKTEHEEGEDDRSRTAAKQAHGGRCVWRKRRAGDGGVLVV